MRWEGQDREDQGSVSWSVMCVYYMLKAVQSKLEVFLRTRGRVGTPLNKTQGKESEKSMPKKRKDE